jgi:hypothetical protein
VLPSSFVALGVLASLAPGYLFLRLTESARAPIRRDLVMVTLEVVSVGIATTGLAVLITGVVAPGQAVQTLNVIQEGLQEPAELRSAAWFLGAEFLGACGLALVAAVGRRLRGKGRYPPSVWSQTLGVKPPDKLLFVMLELTDGRRVDGLVHAFDFNPGEGERDIALSSPIHVATPNTKRVPVAIECIVVSESKIRLIAVRHDDDPSSTQQSRRVAAGEPS